MTAYDTRLSYMVKRAQHAVRQAMDKTLADVALTTPQYAALSALSSETALSNAELARRCFVTPQTMHQLASGLESRGLIGRSQHPEHGRIVQVCISESGRQLLQKAHSLVGIIEAKLTQTVSAQEKIQVSDVLMRCCAALENGES